MIQKALFGAGCFWGVEEYFRQINGIINTQVGYSGGNTKNPTYESVCYENTDHVEVLEVDFDDDIITYDDLVEQFWKCHDPTTINRQGPDVGDQYRSVIFYFNEFQKTEITNNNFPLIRSGFRNDLIDISNYFGISNHSNTEDDWVKTKVIDNSISWESNKSGINLIPNVIGMTYRDALYLLEKRGLKVNFSGSGRVKNQSILPGKNIKNYSTIHLSLR